MTANLSWNADEARREDYARMERVKELESQVRELSERYSSALNDGLRKSKAYNELTERLARASKRAANQRKELRRLNKYLGPYWSGFRRGMALEAECKLRGIMNAAFGHEKVRAAELAALRCRPSEEALKLARRWTLYEGATIDPVIMARELLRIASAFEKEGDNAKDG